MRRPSNDSSGRTGAIFALLALLFLAPRLLHLEADPPRVPNGQSGRELLVEAPAKAYEARKLALFGALSTSDADEYRFWSVQSPAYVFPLAAFMRATGVGYAQLKVYGVLVGLLGQLMLLALLYRRIGRTSLALVVGLTAVQFYYLHYLRAGLLEPSVNTWVIAAVACAVAAERDARWLFGVPIAWTLAFLSKQSAVAFLPLAVLALALGAVAAGPQLNRSRRLGLAAVVAVCATGLFLLVRSDAYAQTVAWNYQHMFHGREAFSGPESSIFGVVFRTLGRLVEWAHWKQGVLMIIPVCLPFVVVHVARNGVRLLRRQPVSHLSLLTMTWFLLGLAALFTVEHARGRFSHILLPPAFLAFGLELDFWLERLDSTRWKWLPVAGIVAATLLTHVRWSSEWLLGPRYALRDANQEIAAVLEPDDAVLGMRAPLLAFDSSADIFYVKHHFNDSADRIARLGATHLLLSNRETATRLLKRSFPEALADAPRLLTLRYGGRDYRLLELGEPLR